MDDSEYSISESPQAAPLRQSVVGCLGYLLAAFFGALLFGSFASAGLILIWKGSLEPIVQTVRTMSWEEVPCEITSSQVAGRKTFWVDIEYRYEYSGQEYIGNRYSFFNQKSSGRQRKERVVQQYPVGRETVCYVNAEKPQESVLSREWNLSILWGLFGIPFLAVGVVGFFGINQYRKAAMKAAPSIQDIVMTQALGDVPGGVPTVVTVSQSEFTDEDLQEVPGPITLKPESNRFISFFVLLFICLVWNGVIFTFVSVLLGDWLQGKWNWLPDLMLIPFILIGIGLAYAAVYHFLALMNPLPTLTLSRQMIPLGGRATLSWKFDRESTSLRKVIVSIKAMEWARYRRGTSTSIDTSVFYEEILVESLDPTQIPSGEVEFEIPSDTMHSFSSRNNAIKWQVHFLAEVSRWPDVKSDFSIRVVPHE